MKTTTEILYIIRSYKPTAKENYGVERMGIFGSAARGEQKETSDVDIFYEGQPMSFIKIDKMQVELENMLGTKVDLVRLRDGMNAMLRKRIQTEGIYA